MGVIQRQGIKNFFTSYIGVVIGFVNVLIVQPRFLTPDELGLTRVLYSFSILVSTIVPFGIANIGVKYFPHFRDAAKKHHGFFGFMLYGVLAGFVITALAVFVFRETIIDQYVEKSRLFAEFFYWIFPLTLILALVTTLNIYCYSLYKSTVPAFINDIVIRVGVIVLISLYYLELFSLHTFITLFVTVYGLQVIMLLAYIFYEEKPGFIIDLSYFSKTGWKPVLSFGLIIWLASISSMGLKELATVILGTKVALAEVAVYVVAAFIPTLIEVPLNALDKIATSNITTALSQNNLKTVNEIYTKSGKYMLLIGGLLFLLINGNIQSLLTFLPENYRGGELIILILSVGTLFNMATGLNSQILIYSGKYFWGAMMMIIAVVINAILQFTFIPVCGVIGAAIATALAGMLMNAANTFLVWKYFHLHPFGKHTITSIAIVLIIYTIDYMIPHFQNTIADIVLHGVIISTLFVLFVYKAGFIPELNNFINIKLLRKKISS